MWRSSEPAFPIKNLRQLQRQTALRLPLVCPGLHFDLFMGLSRMSDLVVAIRLDRFQHLLRSSYNKTYCKTFSKTYSTPFWCLLRLLHVIAFPCQGYLVLFVAGGSIARHLIDIMQHATAEFSACGIVTSTFISVLNACKDREMKGNEMPCLNVRALIVTPPFPMRSGNTAG